MKIALAGNPNCGKTSIYNLLTGKNEKVGNWAGVTISKKESKIRKKYDKTNHDIVIVDLPGAYSLSPFTSEESITINYVKEQDVDVIINIVDSTNLSRSLFLTTQLLELGIPMVVALNKIDLNSKKGNQIDLNKLSDKLDCPVVLTSATRKKGFDKLIKAAINQAKEKRISKIDFLHQDIVDKESEDQINQDRFKFVDSIVEQVEIRKTMTNQRNLQDKIDDILTHKFFGIVIFAIIIYGVFFISQVGPGVYIADLLVGALESFQEFLGNLLTNQGENINIFTSILIDGILGGLIAVISFLPLVMVMYFLIALLEDCGYMARASVVLDPIFKKVGLSGKSVIPFVIGTGCAIPGIMACRTIRDEKERRVTAMLTPFMPCGAKLPVISLFAGVFFANSWLVGASMYLVGLVIIFLSALLINIINNYQGKKSYFIMELPEYKVPSITKSFKSMCSRGWAYIVKAGTIILVCNFIIHVMQNFNFQLQVVGEENADSSILAIVSTPIAYLISPVIGVVSWQLASAAISGFIAKENVVGTIAISYGITNFINPDDLILVGGASEVASIMGINSVAALAFLMFNLFTPPCFAAIGAMNSEINNKKWLFLAIFLQFSVGYSIGFLVFFFGSLFTNTLMSVDLWMIILGWIVVLSIIGIVSYFTIKNRRVKGVNKCM